MAKGKASCHIYTDQGRSNHERTFASPAWLDNFITKEGSDYIGWDETQSMEICRGPFKWQVKQIILEYAATLGHEDCSGTIACAGCGKSIPMDEEGIDSLCDECNAFIDTLEGTE